MGAIASPSSSGLDSDTSLSRAHPSDTGAPMSGHVSASKQEAQICIKAPVADSIPKAATRYRSHDFDRTQSIATFERWRHPAPAA